MSLLVQNDAATLSRNTVRLCDFFYWWANIIYLCWKNLAWRDIKAAKTINMDNYMIKMKRTLSGLLGVAARGKIAAWLKGFSGLSSTIPDPTNLRDYKQEDGE